MLAPISLQRAKVRLQKRQRTLYLKRQPQRKLNLPRSGCGTGNFSGVAPPAPCTSEKVRCRSSEVRPVEDVEKLRPELKVGALVPERRLLHQSKVHVGDSRGNNVVSPHGALEEPRRVRGEVESRPSKLVYIEVFIRVLRANGILIASSGQV